MPSVHFGHHTPTPAATCIADGYNWQKSATFGKPNSAAASTPTSTTTAFQVARTYRFSFGARF